MTSTAADFLANSSTRIEPIKGLEPWNLTAYMRSMTAKDKIEFEASVLNAEQSAIDDEKLKTAKARLLIECVCDSSGRSLFDVQQLDQVQGLDSKLFELIHSQVYRHVGFEKADLERLVKNSRAGQD